MRNELEIQFFGLQRSGNHAVLSWLFQQFDEPVYFFNMVRPFTDPILNWRYAKMPNIVELPRAPSGINPRAEQIAADRQQTLESVRRRNKRVLVHSYENLRLERLESCPLIQDRESWIGQSKRVYRILLLRDFYNWLASRIRLLENKNGALPQQVDSLIELWVGYAKEFIGETKFLGSANIIKASYNRWFVDETYRADLCDKLGVSVRDLSIRHVPQIGGGSSFDGILYAANPQDMQVHTRWEYLCEERLHALTAPMRERREEIEYYNGCIFGPPPLLR